MSGPISACSLGEKNLEQDVLLVAGAGNGVSRAVRSARAAVANVIMSELPSGRDLHRR